MSGLDEFDKTKKMPSINYRERAAAFVSSLKFNYSSRLIPQHVRRKCQSSFEMVKCHEQSKSCERKD